MERTKIMQAITGAACSIVSVLDDPTSKLSVAEEDQLIERVLELFKLNTDLYTEAVNEAMNRRQN